MYSLMALLLILLGIFFSYQMFIGKMMAANGVKSGGNEKSIFFNPSEERLDTAEAIDKELNKRFLIKKAAAAKLVTLEGGHRVLRHKFGQTVLPDHPKRIAVIRMEDPMLSLDLPMVAAHDFDDYYLHDQLKALPIKNISINEDTKTINYEQVQAAQPDLIVMRDSFDKSIYTKLSKIAPVAAYRLNDEEVATMALAMSLGKEAKGEEALRTYYKHVKAVRMAIHEIIGNQTVAMLRVLNKEIRLYPYARNDINRFMYELLNLKAPQMVIDGDKSTTNNVISFEMLPDLHADYLLVSTGYGPSSNGNNAQAEDTLRRMQKDELWQTIPAVAAGHVIQIDASIWNAHGLLAKEMAMDQLLKALEKNKYRMDKSSIH